MILTSCDRNKNDVIPDVFVNFSIRIDDPEFDKLKVILEHVVITAQTNNLGPNAAGFSGNGIIVFNSSGDFVAFDRTCPYDYHLTKNPVKVEIDWIHAVCPSCSTKYDLTASGMPVSGPGKYYLKNYKTSFYNPFISVWNKI